MAVGGFAKFRAVCSGRSRLGLLVEVVGLLVVALIGVLPASAGASALPTAAAAGASSEPAAFPGPSSGALSSQVARKTVQDVTPISDGNLIVGVVVSTRVPATPGRPSRAAKPVRTSQPFRFTLLPVNYSKMMPPTEAVLRSSFNLRNVVIAAVSTTRGSCRIELPDPNGFPGVECELGTLGFGDQARVKVYVRALESGRLINTTSIIPPSTSTGYRESTGSDSVTVRPTVAVSGLPGRCARRALTAQVRIADVAFARGEVYLDDRRLRATRRNEFSVDVPADRLQPGRHRLLVIATNQSGAKHRRGFALRRC